MVQTVHLLRRQLDILLGLHITGEFHLVNDSCYFYREFQLRSDLTCIALDCKGLNKDYIVWYVYNMQYIPKKVIFYRNSGKSLKKTLIIEPLEQFY